MYGGYILREIVPKESKILNKNLLKLKMRIYLHIYVSEIYLHIYMLVNQNILNVLLDFDWLLKDVF